MKSLLFSLILTSQIYAIDNNTQAPEFNLNGAPTKAALNDHKGKFVVLEWFNEGCPFVRKHYDAKNMQMLQKKYRGKVSWLTINSSAPGKQGYLKNSDAAKETYSKEQMQSISLLLDSNGEIGQKYGAKTTPHMFIIDPKGSIVYQGAIDSVASANQADIHGATNYVDKALGEVLAGKAVSVAKSKPYGCSVKY
ncbi:MAG: redoxin domain-containing protein [Bdellovibrionota bacterium]|nr:redoxin domain-containing protein [Bdellovibrionota bacterium]